MKSKFNLLFMILLASLFLSPLVSSFMPNTHYLIHQRAFENPIDSSMYNDCMAFPELCWAGNQLTDISVYFYYTQRDKYSTTHSPNFCRALLETANTPRERACAVSGCTHQPQDIVSHNEMVVYSIKHSGLVNNIIHVFAEQKLDNWVVKNNPGIDVLSGEQLNAYQECVPLFKEVMLGEPAYRTMSEQEIDDFFGNFIAEVQNSQTGYDTAFKNKGFFVSYKTIPLVLVGAYIGLMLMMATLVILLGFKVFRKKATIRHFIAIVLFGLILGVLLFFFISIGNNQAFDNFITVIKPVSNLVPIGGNQAYIDKAVLNTKLLLTQGEQWLFDTEASGFTALDAADKSVQLLDYLLFGVLIILFISYTWYLFKR